MKQGKTSKFTFSSGFIRNSNLKTNVHTKCNVSSLSSSGKIVIKCDFYHLFKIWIKKKKKKLRKHLDLTTNILPNFNLLAPLSNSVKSWYFKMNSFLFNFLILNCFLFFIVLPSEKINKFDAIFNYEHLLYLHFCFIAKNLSGNDNSLTFIIILPNQGVY